MVTGTRDSEEPLLEPHLAAATARGTGLGRGSRLGAFPSAGIADRHAWYRDRLLSAKRRLFKGDLQVIAEVFPPPAPPPAAASSTGPKEVTEDIAEDVLEAGGEIGSAAKAGPALLEGAVAVAVVQRPFLRIRKNLIRFG